MNKTTIFLQRGESKQQFITKLLIIAAIIILVVSCWLWWSKVRNNPERVLYGAIENSLRTRSITRQAGEAGTDSQILRVDTSPLLRTHTMTTRVGNMAEDKSTVSTEAIGTQKAEYVRWTKIETSQKNKKGDKLDFSSVLNIWGENSGSAPQQQEQIKMSLLSGVALVGNFDVHDRQTLMSEIKKNNVYTFDKSKVERKSIDGRPVYIYELEINPFAFYNLAKKYGEITNIEQLKAFDTSQFKGMPNISTRWTVDVWSRNITAITDTRGSTERLGGYGLSIGITPPKKSIPLDELQAKLNALLE